MTKECLCCGFRWEAEGECSGVSHGYCSTYCRNVWLTWNAEKRCKQIPLMEWYYRSKAELRNNEQLC